MSLSRFCKVFISCMLSFSLTVTADAQTRPKGPGTEKKTPDNASDNSYFTLGEVVVSDTATGPLLSKDILTSVDILGSKIVENQNVNYSWELFNRLPGVMLTQFNQGTTSGKFSFRGFNGEGEINAVKLLIDGIPSNSNDGNMPYIDMIFPLDIESIETVRGTNDPRYGLHNIAGNANINTRVGGNYTRGRLSYGSFNTLEAQAFGGLEKNGFSQNYFAAYRTSDGYRDHSDLERFTFAGKWFYTPEHGRYRVGLIARWYENDAEEPGYLTLSDAYRQPTMTNAYNASDGGKREIGQFSGHLDAEITPELFWSLKSYVNLLNDKRWVKFSSTAIQQERIADETQYGAITTLTYRPKIRWLNDFALESGFDIQQQDNTSLRYEDVVRVRTRQTRNQDFDFHIFGGFMQAVVKPFSWLKLVPGFRVDHAGGSLIDYATAVSPTTRRFAINDYDMIWQPKFSAVITPVEGYSLYGNWGRTFQVGVGSGAYRSRPTAAAVGPSINDGWEIGVKLSPVKWFEGRLAYWEQTATDEVRRKLNDPFGDGDNIGATKRKGFDAQLNVRPIDPLNIWFAYSLQNAKIERPGPTEAGNRGKEIDHVPDFVFSGGIDYQVTPKFGTSLWTYAQGDYFLERSNFIRQNGIGTRQFGSYFLLNLAFNYQVTKQVNLDFQVKNITDEYWEYVWFDGAQTLHSPGDGRAFYGAVNVKFDY